jgi:D-glycero-D-manno-heptose 1,7-bisphosphate phosphatase
LIGSAAADKVVILDRDGTLVVDYGYLGDPAALKFEPTAADALRWLYRRGYRLVVITNQSGVGRGLFPIERVEAMNARLHAMVEELGVRLERIYYCPHSPDAGCDCRKPALGLMLRAASELSFDPKRAVVIGDKDSDIQFGQGAGAKTILIARGLPVTAGRAKPDVVSQNLLHAARTVTLHEW